MVEGGGASGSIGFQVTEEMGALLCLMCMCVLHFSGYAADVYRECGCLSCGGSRGYRSLVCNRLSLLQEVFFQENRGELLAVNRH